MGFLITAHVFQQAPDPAGLEGLPKSIGYRLYQHRGANLYLLDTFRSSKTPRYPFQTLLPAADIPLEFPQGLELLERVFAQLGPLNLANGFKRSYVNFALLLNRLLKLPVFSFVSDDDELDFTCSATDGATNRLRCRCGDLVISYSGGRVQIAPLAPEAEEDEDLLTDTATFKAALPDVEVLPRATPWNSQLHWIAIEELQAFAGIRQPILGLGSFDPTADESDWQLVVAR